MGESYPSGVYGRRAPSRDGRIPCRGMVKAAAPANLEAKEVDCSVTRAILEVPNISCEHCERTVRETLEPLAGVSAVEVDVPAKSVTVDYDDRAVSIGRMSEALA